MPPIHTGAWTGVGEAFGELSILEIVWKFAPTRTIRTLNGDPRESPTRHSGQLGKRRMIFANFLCARRHAGPGSAQRTCKAPLVPTNRRWACGKEGPYHQQTGQSLHLGPLRGSKMLFAQAEATPSAEILAHHSQCQLTGAGETGSPPCAHRTLTVLALAGAPERKSLKMTACPFTN